MIRGLCDIDDNNPNHKEAVWRATQNLGMELHVMQTNTASDMFYKVWNIYACDGEMTDTQAEEMICEEVNMWLEDLEGGDD